MIFIFPPSENPLLYPNIAQNSSINGRKSDRYFLRKLEFINKIKEALWHGDCLFKTTMASPETLVWREKNKELIGQWQAKIKEVRFKIAMERWDNDKFEMEIVSCIDDQILRDVFMFAKNYIARYKSGNFRNLMFETYNEIVQYGTIEPSWLLVLCKKIASARRKMKWQ